MHTINTASVSQTSTETLSLHEIDKLCYIINGSNTASTIKNFIDKCVEDSYYHLPELVSSLELASTIATSTGKGYADTVTALADSDITFTVTGNYYRFTDPEIIEKLKSSIGDGVGLTSSDVTTVTALGTTFANSLIKDFSEFSLFTGVTAIGTGAFDNSDLKLIIFPNTVTTVNPNSFVDCENLIIVITKSDGMTQLNGSGVLGCTPDAIYVPDTLLNSYRATTSTWSTYREHVIEPDSDRLLNQLLFDNGDRIRFDNNETVLE